MAFLTNLIENFLNNDSVVGLTSLNKLAKKNIIYVPNNIKITPIQDVAANYLLK